MADGLDPNQSKIVKDYEIRLKTSGAPDASRAVKQLEDAFRSANAQVGKSTSSIDKFDLGLSKLKKDAIYSKDSVLALAGAFTMLGSSMTRLSSSAGVMSMLTGGGALAEGAREVKEYYKAILETTNQFQAYGTSLKRVEGTMKSLQDQFKFTRNETLQLMSSIERGFTYKPVEQMANYMKILEQAVGANSQAMAGFSSQISSVMQKMPGLQKQIADWERKENVPEKELRGLQSQAALLMSSGNIGAGEYKTVMSLTSAVRGLKGEGDKSKPITFGTGQNTPKEYKDALKTYNNLEKTANEVAISLGENLLPAMDRFSKALSNPAVMKTLIAIGTIGAPLALVAGGASMIGKVGGLFRMLDRLRGGGGKSPVDAVLGAAGSVGGDGIRVFVTNMPGGGLGGLGGNKLKRAGLSGKSPMEEAAEELGMFGGKKLGWKQGGLAGRMGVGAAGQGMMGLGAGIAAGYGTEWAAGKRGMTSAEDGGLAASMAEVAITIGAGFAAGGPIGAIAAGVSNIVKNGIKAFNVAGDTKQTLKEEGELNSTIKKIDDQLAEKMKGRTVNEQQINEYRRWMSEYSRNKAAREYENNKHSGAGFVADIAFTGGIGAGYQMYKKSQRDKAQAEDDKMAAEILEKMRELKKEINKDPEVKKRIDAEKEVIVEKQKQVDEARKLLESNLLLTQSEEDLAKIMQIQQRLLAANRSEFEVMAELSKGLAGVFGDAELLSSAKSYQESVHRTNELYRQQNKLLDERLRINNVKAGGSPEEIAAAKKKLNDALASNDVNKQLDAIKEIGMTEAGVSAIEATRVENLAKINSSLTTQSKINSDILRQYELKTELAQSESDIMDLQVQQADNLAMGVAASASMRMEQVKKIGQVMSVNEEKLKTAREQYNNAIQKERELKEAVARGDKSALDDLKEAVMAENNARLTINKTVAENLRLQNKQLELTKLLRDGWLGAINAMNNGVGMFEKIALSKDKRLGTVMAYEPKKVVGIATGFAGKGRTESTSFSSQGVGVLTNPEKAGESFGGGSKEWNRAMDKRSPLGFLGSQGFDINNPEFLSKLQESLKDSKISMNLAGATSTPFGMSELIEAGKKAESGMKRASDGVQRSTTPASALPSISPVPGEKGSSIDNKQMDKFKAEVLESMTKAFRGICDAAMTRVMDDLQKGR